MLDLDPGLLEALSKVFLGRGEFAQLVSHCLLEQIEVFWALTRGREADLTSDLVYRIRHSRVDFRLSRGLCRVLLLFWASHVLHLAEVDAPDVADVIMRLIRVALQVGLIQKHHLTLERGDRKGFVHHSHLLLSW